MSPWWLLALIVVPLIRWLHKTNTRAMAIPVSSLVFWKMASAVSLSYRRGLKADPIWMLRALIAVAIVLALADPLLPNHQKRVVRVWFDDAYSLQTTEKGAWQDRLKLAIDAVLEKLAISGPLQVHVYSLRNPGKGPLLLDAQNPAGWSEQLSGWITLQSKPLSAPPAGEFIAEGENWLVTDGADPALKQALAAIPVQQIIRVGQATENAALTLLSVRPSLQEPNRWQGTIQVQHFGDSASDRTIELWRGDQKLQQWPVHLLPEQSRNVDFSVDQSLSNTPIVARLTPADELAEDDRLSLNLPVPINVRIHGDCPPPLLAAIAAHPFLRTDVPAAGRTAELDIVCGDLSLGTSGPRLHFHRGGEAQTVDVPPVWTEAAGALGDVIIPPRLIRRLRPLAHQGNGIPLLQAGSLSLITLADADPVVLDCFIDMGASDFAGQAEYPALFAGLVDMAMKRPYLDPQASMSREAEASRIKPLALESAGAGDERIFQKASLDGAPYLIWLAMLLLALDDLLALARRSRRGLS